MDENREDTMRRFREYFRNLKDEEIDMLHEEGIVSERLFKNSLCKRNRRNRFPKEIYPHNPPSKNTQNIILAYDETVGEYFYYRAAYEYIDECADAISGGGNLRNYIITKSNEKRKLYIRLMKDLRDERRIKEIRKKLDEYKSLKYDKTEKSRIHVKYGQTYIIADDLILNSSAENLHITKDFQKFLGIRLGAFVEIDEDIFNRNFIIDKCIMHEDNDDPDYKRWESAPNKYPELSEYLAKEVLEHIRKIWCSIDKNSSPINVCIPIHIGDNINIGRDVNIKNSESKTKRKNKSTSDKYIDFVRYITITKPEWYIEDDWVDFAIIKNKFDEHYHIDSKSNILGKYLKPHIRRDIKYKYLKNGGKITYWKLKELANIDI